MNDYENLFDGKLLDPAAEPGAFSQLNSLKTPEGWIEAALQIPTNRKKPLPRLLRPAFIGAAAALIIVTAVIWTLALHAGGPAAPLPPQPDLPIAESTVPTSSVPAETTTEGTAAQTAPTATVTPTHPAAQPTTQTVTQPTTQPVTHPTVHPPTQPVTHPITQPTTQPVTIPVTVPATDPLTELPTVSPTVTLEEPDTEAPQSEYFNGDIRLFIGEDNPFYPSANVRAEIPGCGAMMTLSLTAGEDGFKTAVYHPIDLMLDRWQTYVLHVVNAKGNSQTVFFVPGDGDQVHVYL